MARRPVGEENATMPTVVARRLGTYAAEAMALALLVTSSLARSPLAITCSVVFSFSVGAAVWYFGLRALEPPASAAPPNGGKPAHESAGEGAHEAEIEARDLIQTRMNKLIDSVEQRIIYAANDWVLKSAFYDFRTLERDVAALADRSQTRVHVLDHYLRGVNRFLKSVHGASKSGISDVDAYGAMMLAMGALHSPSDCPGIDLTGFAQTYAKPEPYEALKELELLRSLIDDSSNKTSST
jgi:hypothetical protein